MLHLPVHPLLATASSTAANSALVTFALYLVGVFILAALANRLQRKREFASEYFLGSRNLGMWAFALTFAATAASGGSFMGFPALIYSSGWVLAWWIAGYAMVPLVALGMLGKRINQVGRIAKAITIPELLRRRFDSATVGNTATLLVVFFLFFYLIAQFKAGGEIMATLLSDVSLFQQAVAGVERVTQDLPWIGQSSGDELLCRVAFAISVIVYTAWGGFRAVVWTDVMQGLVMAVGVVLLLVLTLAQVGGLEKATRDVAKMTPPELGSAVLQMPEARETDQIFPRGTWMADATGHPFRLKSNALIPAGAVESEVVEVLRVTSSHEIERLRDLITDEAIVTQVDTTPYAYGADELGVYVSAPGPSQSNPVGFLTVSLAFSFFVFWNFSSAGQPSGMVRQMAYDNTKTLRRSLLLVTLLYTLIYFPLVLVFTSARVLLPGMEIYPDRIMPEMAAHVTTVAGIPWLAGLLVAAPFAAVMSTVDSFLLMVSSGVVRDIYQQNINPNASEKTVKKLSYTVTVIVGILALIAVLNPPRYLQDLIIFASGGIGASFLMPMVFALYWPRMTSTAATAGMLSGGGTILLLYTTGYLVKGSFGEYNLLGLHPFIWAVFVTSSVIISVSLAGKSPDARLVKTYFGR